MTFWDLFFMLYNFFAVENEDLKLFFCRELCVKRQNQFFDGGGGGFFEDRKKFFLPKVLYWCPGHTLKWALQYNFTPPPYQCEYVVSDKVLKKVGIH